MPILELKDVRYSYSPEKAVLRGVNCVFECGTLYALVGKSGAGKSTLLSLMAGLDLPDSGQVLFEGTPTGDMDLDEYRRRKAAVIYQDFALFPLLTALENIEYPMELCRVEAQEAERQARELARRAGKVVSVELDRRLWPVLEETMAGCENFTLVQGDVMQQDLAALVGEHFGGLRPILCANLPYNITTPLLTRVVESRCFDSVTVLIQKEVAQRICAAPETADYGAFSLLMQYYTRPELVFEVPNTCFLPAPKVTSAVIHCPARRVQVCSEAMLWRTVRAGFALRRKTLVNSLQTGFPLPKDQLAAIVTGCGLPENVRGERLSLADYAALANALAAVV